MFGRDIRLYRGDRHLVRIHIQAVGGANLTLSKAWFTVKRDLSDDDDDAVIALNTADHGSKLYWQDNGTPEVKLIVRLKGADTDGLEAGRYFYDAQVMEEGTEDPHTVLLAFFRVLADVTRTAV